MMNQPAVGNKKGKQQTMAAAARVGWYPKVHIQAHEARRGKREDAADPPEDEPRLRSILLDGQRYRYSSETSRLARTAYIAGTDEYSTHAARLRWSSCADRYLCSF